ncbi:MAG: exopolysaccharide biosynthesis protein [Rhodobacterales bacterium]
MRGSKSYRLGDLVERLHEVSQQQQVSVKDIVSAVGRRSMIPFLLIPAFLAATPLSGIPGLSATCGILITLVSVRLILKYDEMVLPRWIERKSVNGDRLRSALESVAPVVGWIDRHTKPRWRGLFHRPLIWVPETLCLISGLTMPFLEFIPFSASIVATGVCLLALSMLLRDGLLFLIALVPYAALIYLVISRFM